MSRDLLATSFLAAVLVLGGALAWWTQLQAPLRPSASSLAGIPLQLGEFRGREVPLEETVESMLAADFNLQRDYRHPFGDLVSLYVGYYGTERGGTPEHTPRVCYGSHGWEVVRTEEIERTPGGPNAQEYLVYQRGQHLLVHFWYRSYRAPTLASVSALRVDHVLGRWSDGRGDGALIRLSTPLFDGDLLAARSRLLVFGQLLEKEIGPRWPHEMRGE